MRRRLTFQQWLGWLAKRHRHIWRRVMRMPRGDLLVVKRAFRDGWRTILPGVALMVIMHGEAEADHQDPLTYQKFVEANVPDVVWTHPMVYRLSPEAERAELIHLW